MKYILASVAVFSAACSGSLQGSPRAGSNDSPRSPKNPAKFEALPALSDEGPIADRPARMLRAFAARGHNVTLQKDKSILLTTEKFGVVIPTGTAHLCEFDVPFFSGKGVTDEASLVAIVTKVDSYYWGTNFTLQPDGPKFRVTARRASVVRNEGECAEIADRVLYALNDTVETMGNAYGIPVFPGGAHALLGTLNGTTIQLGNSAAGTHSVQDGGPQGYLDYYYGMLDAEGVEPRVDDDGDIRFSYEGNTLFIEMPNKVNQFRQFSLGTSAGKDAKSLSVDQLRAGCMDAMNSNVFVSCVATQHEQRVLWSFNASSHVGRESDPRYNFRNMAAAVHQSGLRATKYLAGHQ